LAPNAIQAHLFPKDFSTLGSEIFTLCGRLVLFCVSSRDQMDAAQAFVD